MRSFLKYRLFLTFENKRVADVTKWGKNFRTFLFEVPATLPICHDSQNERTCRRALNLKVKTQNTLQNCALSLVSLKPPKGGNFHTRIRSSNTNVDVYGHTKLWSSV